MPRILVSDTVGFIKKLPHDLVASFRSTLDEARDADLLLHVVDASDPAFPAQLEVTREVLREIGADRRAAPAGAQQGRPARRRRRASGSPPSGPTRCCSRRRTRPTSRRCASASSRSSSATWSRRSSSCPYAKQRVVGEVHAIVPRRRREPRRARHAPARARAARSDREAARESLKLAARLRLATREGTGCSPAARYAGGSGRSGRSPDRTATPHGVEQREVAGLELVPLRKRRARFEAERPRARAAAGSSWRRCGRAAVGAKPGCDARELAQQRALRASGGSDAKSARAAPARERVERREALLDRGHAAIAIDASRARRARRARARRRPACGRRRSAG